MLTYVNMTYTGTMLDSSSYKTLQNDVILMYNRSKRFHYQMMLHSSDHNQAFLLVEASSFFRLTRNNVLSSVRAPKDFSIVIILNSKVKYKIYLKS